MVIDDEVTNNIRAPVAKVILSELNKDRISDVPNASVINHEIVLLGR